MRYSLSALLLITSIAPAAEPDIPFNRAIRPILSEYCFTCHGPDTAKRKAGLRLDTEEGGRTVLTAGKPDHSELYLRVVGKGDGKRMPPQSTGKVVPPAQAALLRKWIEQGAKYEAHWSFMAPKRAAVPLIKEHGRARNPIDQFLLARLEAEKLAPAPEADRRVLIRRLSFDLLGLPPTPAEVDAFVNDPGPKAYEQLVDRLLSSRHFGERMALFWLDLVRYADTGGYHSDNHRDIYLYRDYVIRSFNDNKRFDRFTLEQLAGDLLPDANAESRIASGYNRLLMTTEEGGAQAKEYLAKYAADRVRNASSVWLGLTMGCAECHNHKYDPISAKEFYQFASFWADIQEVAVGRQPQVKMPTPEYQQRLASLDADLAEARKRLTESLPSLAAGQKLWEEKARAELASAKPSWVPTKPTKVVSSGGATLKIQPDLSVLSTDKNPAKDTYTVTLETDLKGITGLRLAALRDPSLNGGYSRANGNFVLTGLSVAQTKQKGKPVPVKFSAARADFSQPGFPVESLLAGKGAAGWAVEGHLRRDADREAVFTFAKPLAGGPGTTLVVKLEHNSIYPQHNIGRFRLDLTTTSTPSLGEKAGFPDVVARALRTEASKLTPADREVLAAHYRTVAPELEPDRKKLAELTQAREALEKELPQTLVSMPVAPRMMRILPRGNWLDDTGEVVAPGTPASLPKLTFTGKRATRLDLARWLVSAEHPLTARVFVNRLWKLTFGQGLVTSMEDFGAQGSSPSHEELLDWLAVEFVASGWDVKHMLRLMVTSAAYRQSSSVSNVVRNRDPYNRLLARQARFRLDAELVRDNALAVSDLLVRKVGGPSVKPYQPAGYWAYLNFPTRSWTNDQGEDQYRRGLYTYWQRTFPHPSLLAFDAPSREECTAERPRSNTPQQALVLLNDPSYVEAARVLAEKAIRAGKTDEDRLNWAYRQVLGRLPRASETSVVLPLLQSHLAQYRASKTDADAILNVGLTPAAKEMDRPTLAAWTSVARVLLNLHETITRE